MNIHFKDKNTFKKLTDATIFTVQFGSRMYGTNDENSDTDLLHIYVPSISERNSFWPSHHQLQYKDNDTDHNFVNVFAFIKNLINGDSSVNFEIINHESIKGSPLDFLFYIRHSFYNYKILRSFNGFCRRDIREYHKANSDLEKNKRIGHIIRGHEFSKMILDKNFSPIIIGDLKEKLLNIKNLSDNKERKNIVSELKSDVEGFRIRINELHDQKNLGLPMFMNVDDQIILDRHINDLINSSVWNDRKDWYLEMRCFFEANENPEIKY